MYPEGFYVYIKGKAYQVKWLKDNQEYKRGWINVRDVRRLNEIIGLVESGKREMVFYEIRESALLGGGWSKYMFLVPVTEPEENEFGVVSP